MCILIHLGEMLYTFIGYILSNQIKNLTVNQRATSTNRLLHGCGCCDNWSGWCCLPFEFLLPEHIGNGD